MKNIFKILLSKKKKYKKICFNTNSLTNEVFDFIAKELADGVDIIELENKTFCKRQFIDFGYKIRELTAHFDALLMIKGDVDSAKLIGADGVVLDESSLTIFEVKKLAEETLIVGYDSKSFEDTTFAQKSGYDFVACSKIFSDIKIFQFINS